MLVEGDEIGDVDVAVVLLRQHILPNMVATYLYCQHTVQLAAVLRGNIPIYEGILQLELQHEAHQLLLNLPVGLRSTSTLLFREQTERVH